MAVMVYSCGLSQIHAEYEIQHTADVLRARKRVWGSVREILFILPKCNLVKIVHKCLFRWAFVQLPANGDGSNILPSFSGLFFVRDTRQCIQCFRQWFFSPTNVGAVEQRDIFHRRIFIAHSAWAAMWNGNFWLYWSTHTYSILNTIANKKIFNRNEQTFHSSGFSFILLFVLLLFQHCSPFHEQRMQ